MLYRIHIKRKQKQTGNPKIKKQTLTEPYLRVHPYPMWSIPALHQTLTIIHSLTIISILHLFVTSQTDVTLQVIYT